MTKTWGELVADFEHGHGVPDPLALVLVTKLQERGRFEDWMNDHRDRVLELSKAWVEGHRDWSPSAEDRMLMLLRELIRCDDASEEPNRNLQMAAGGCRNEKDLGEMVRHAVEKGWTGSLDPNSAATRTDRINFPAHLYMEELTRDLDLGRQGFVALWFDKSMDEAYDKGICPAIRGAGYIPRLIKDKEFTGPVVDEILAEIRKSKFVVVDLTSCDECIACEKCEYIGAHGVYLEAGFALGLGKTVFLTCRADRTKAVHFDIDYLNRIEWKTPEELREKLKNSILAVLDQGPLDPPDDQPTDSR